MHDLIPIGTVNRTAAENNAVKNSDKVKATAPSGSVFADQKQRVEAPQRRFKRRRGDRRVVRGVRWTKPERRKNPDRRAAAFVDECYSKSRSAGRYAKSEAVSRKSVSRKGRVIDEQA